MQALPRTPVPVLKLALSIAPLQTIIKVRVCPYVRISVCLCVSVCV
jgi:hypothetical protein